MRSIPAPLAVTWFQCVVTSAILYVLGELGRGAPEGSFFAQFPVASFDYKLATSRSVAMLSLVFVGMITFNNLSLKYVEVSFYNVARSLTIVFNVALTYVMLGESTSGCLRASAVDAFSHGFQVTVVEECCFDRCLLTHKINLFDMHHKYADVMRADKVVAHLDSL